MLSTNPPFDVESVYSPAGRFGKTNAPSSSVCAERSVLVSTPDNVTEARRTGRPTSAETTTPLIAAVLVALAGGAAFVSRATCARAGAHASITIATSVGFDTVCLHVRFGREVFDPDSGHLDVPSVVRRGRGPGAPARRYRSASGVVGR